MSILAAEEFHDIAPPVDYSLLPPWVIFAGTFLALTTVGLIIWLIAKRRKRPQPPQLPRDRALEALERMRDQIDLLNPYQFSIRVSDILRRYVTEQHGLPVTRQTSMEFLNALAKTPQFSSQALRALASGWRQQATGGIVIEGAVMITVRRLAENFCPTSRSRRTTTGSSMWR